MPATDSGWRMITRTWHFWDGRCRAREAGEVSATTSVVRYSMALDEVLMYKKNSWGIREA
jgi:hypothetical protein